MLYRTSTSADQRRAFTLVELLVVIGIIAVLIAILMPALQRARQVAIQTECLSNIRQCALGFQEYANEFMGYVPNQVIYGEGGGFYNWPSFLCYGSNFGINPAPPTAGTFVKYIDYHVTICPSTLRYDTDINAQNGAIGYALYQEDAFDAHYRDGDQFQQETSLAPGSLFDYNNEWTVITQKMNNPISCDGVPLTPDQMPMLTDSYEDHTAFWPGGHMYAEFITSDDSWVPVSSWGGGPYNCAIQTVHDLVANVAFYDGHAESLAVKALRERRHTRAVHV